MTSASGIENEKQAYNSIVLLRMFKSIFKFQSTLKHEVLPSDQLSSFYVLLTFQLLLLRIIASLSKTAYERGHGGGVELLAALQQPEELPAHGVHAVEDG